MALSNVMEACNKAGIRYYKLPVALEALTVAVNPKNDSPEENQSQLKAVFSFSAIVTGHLI
jgi:ABC-type phosphate transport system substrate-binding protein